MTARARVPSRWPSRRLAASRRGVSVRPGRRRVARFVSFRFARVDEVLASTSDDSPMTYGPSDHESSLVLYRVYPGVHAKTRLVLVLSRRVRRALLRSFAPSRLRPRRSRAIDRSIVHSCPVSSSFVGHALDRETRARVERRATAGAMKRRFRPRATATATTTTRGVVSERHHRHRRALESSRERDVSSLVR